MVGGSVPFVLFFEGLARASSSQAAFIHKTLVIWVAVLAIPLLYERLRALHVVAIATLLAGQAVLAGGLVGFRFGRGEWLILGATLLWSVEVVLAKWLLRDVPARTVAVVRMAAGAMLLTVWVASAVDGPLAGLDSEGWTWAALTGVVLAGYVALWFSALALAPAVDVTAVLVVAAVVTGVLNVAVKGSAMTNWTGMLVELVGAAAAGADHRRASRVHPRPARPGRRGRHDQLTARRCERYRPRGVRRRQGMPTRGTSTATSLRCTSDAVGCVAGPAR